MPTIQRFEDVIAWQKARKLTQAIYSATKQPSFNRDYGLKDQIRRAVVSVMANVAEGFERSGDREFIQFLSIAKGSCGEARSHLYVALDEGYLESSQFNALLNLALETSRTIDGFMAYLRNSSARGRKFSSGLDPAEATKPKT